MPGVGLSIVRLTGLGGYLDSVINGFYGASRLLLLPTITGMSRVNCELLRNFCCSDGLLTVNYRVVGRVAVVKASLGSIMKNEVPCIVDTHRMPPLARFVDSGVVSVKGNSLIINNWSDYMRVVESSKEASTILELVSALKHCNVYMVNSLSRCLRVDEDEVLRALIILRMLYPALIEVILANDLTINSMLRELGIGRLLSIDELFKVLMAGNAGEAIAVPSNLLRMPAPSLATKPRLRRYPLRGRSVGGDFVVVRSSTSKYSIPSILNLVDFNNAIVADIGCGFGIKGTYGIRHGASFVILIDIDEGVLRLRRSGWAVDRVVADARRLPLRDSSVDVVIFWNVVNFIKDKESSINEVKRICRREAVISVYNAVNAYWNYDYKEFIAELLKIGRPIVIKRAGNTQFQAIVRVSHD